MNSIFDCLRWCNKLAVFRVHQMYLVLNELIEIISYHIIILFLLILLINIFGIN